MQNTLKKAIIAGATALIIVGGAATVPGAAFAVGKGTSTFGDGFYGSGYGWSGYAQDGYAQDGYAEVGSYGACGPYGYGYGEGYRDGYAPGNWDGCGEAPYGYYR